MVSVVSAVATVGSPQARIYVPDGARLLACTIQWVGASTVRVGNSTLRLPSPPHGIMATTTVDLHRAEYCGEVWAVESTLAWASAQLWLEV